MNVRIVPHYDYQDDMAKWRVEIKVVKISIGRFKLWRWEKVDDCCTFDYAKLLVKELKEWESFCGVEK